MFSSQNEPLTARRENFDAGENLWVRMVCRHARAIPRQFIESDVSGDLVDRMLATIGWPRPDGFGKTVSAQRAPRGWGMPRPIKVANLVTGKGCQPDTHYFPRVPAVIQAIKDSFPEALKA